MIIIGILAAIAIPVFLSQRKKAQDTAAKADVSTLGKEIATYFVDGTTFPAVIMNATTGQYSVAGNDVGHPSANVVLQPIVGTTATNWCVWVTNPQGDKAVAGYQYAAASGLTQGNCTTTT
jgi:type II secretory pathway pseudopilin PulG